MARRPAAPEAWGAALATVLALAPRPAWATPVTGDTPGLDGPQVTAPRTADFRFAHRFDVIASKVFNSPTFTFDLGLLDRVSAGVRYATSSDVGTGPNELEPIVKVEALRQRRAAPVDLTAEIAYNSQAKSADGALVAARDLGPVRLLANARGFSDAYGEGGAAFAGGIGASLAVVGGLRAVGDLNRVIAAQRESRLAPGWDRVGWSAGLAFPIPYSPHTLSLYATNVNTRTLQGSSRGSDTVRYGFEFDVPLEGLARWVGIVRRPAARGAPAASAAAPAAAEAPPPSGPSAQAVEVTIENDAFRPAEIAVHPGDTVRWVNRDRVPHTVAEKSGGWTSPLLQEGSTFERRFDSAGSTDYVCTVHPFMHGKVVVRP